MSHPVFFANASPAIPHLLASIFNTPVLTHVSPTASTPPTAAAYGCALLAAASGDQAKIRTLSASQYTFSSRSRATPPLTPRPKGGTLPTPPNISRAGSFLHLALTPNSPPRLGSIGIQAIQAPPSPAASDSEEPEPWLVEVQGTPEDQWEHAIYEAMMPEFVRIR